MSALEVIVFGLQNMRVSRMDGHEYYCGQQVAVSTQQAAAKELADLRARIAELEAEKSRLSQENIRLNNNEDFLDARIAQLEALTTWQPIETAPQEGKYILVCGAASEVFSIDPYFSDDDRLTHWMPLPKPPEEK